MKKAGKLLPGVYPLKIDSETVTMAYCDEDGFTTIQSRCQCNNPQDYFNKLWHDYKVGFGIPGNWYASKILFEYVGKTFLIKEMSIGLVLKWCIKWLMCWLAVSS